MKRLLARKEKVDLVSIVLCVIAAIFLSGCGSDSDDNAAGNPVSTHNPPPPAAADIAPYEGSNPYENVVSFMGDAYSGIDPDTRWLKATREKLDNMPNDQHLLREEYDQIIQRQTEIQYKYDRLSEYYQQLKDMQSATIDPYTAVEFRLESFCLNVRLKIPTSDTTYDEVMPMEEHIQKILEWYYSKPKPQDFSLQFLIWDVQDYVHNGDAYDSALNSGEKQWLEEIFGANAKDYLTRMRTLYGEGGAAKSVKGVEAVTSLEKKILYFAKRRSKDVVPATAKDPSVNSGNVGYFNLGNGLIGKFISYNGFDSSKIQIINNTDHSIEFKPFSFLLKQKGRSDYQSIALGALSDLWNDAIPTAEAEELNRLLNPQAKLNEKPTCNMTDEHRNRIIEYALPDDWSTTPYNAKNSKEDGMVCDQYVHWVYEEAGLDYPPTPTWRMPSSPFFTETPKNNVKDGDIILWLSYDGKIHHMGIWVEHPANYGGSPDSLALSARTHGGKSKLPVGNPNFIPAVDWTKKNDFNVDYRIFRFKGDGSNAPNCPLR